MLPTILLKDCEALLHQQVGIQDDEAKREREDIVAGSPSQEVSDRFLQRS